MITPRQSRAARALLDIQRDKLAAAADIPFGALIHFEQGRAIDPKHVAALEEAFADRGVQFLRDANFDYIAVPVETSTTLTPNNDAE